jgi:hypothetical protein
MLGILRTWMFNLLQGIGDTNRNASKVWMELQ